MLARWLGTAAMALVAGGAYLLAGCDSFGAATTGGDPNGVGNEAGGSADAGGGTEGSDGGVDGDGGGSTDAATGSSLDLIGEWKLGPQVTIPPGTNRLLLVTVHIEDNDSEGWGAMVNSMRLGQQPLARGGRAVSVEGTKQQAVELWYLNEAGIAAATGGSISVQLSRTPNETPAYTHAFFSGVDQVKPFGESKDSSAAGGDTIMVGPVFVPERHLAVGACSVSESVQVKPDAPMGVSFQAGSHAGATAWVRGEDVNVSMTFVADTNVNRQVASLVVLNPAR